MNRRGFLTGMAGILGAGYSAAILPSGVIMPIRKLWTPEREIVVGFSQLRDVDYIRIGNTSTTSHSQGSVYLDLSPFTNAAPDDEIAVKVSLKSSETLHYERGIGWYVIDANGSIAK